MADGRGARLAPPFGVSLPTLLSKAVRVENTRSAGKSTASLVKLTWQLTEVSGCSWAMASVWAAEQEPGGGGRVDTRQPKSYECGAGPSSLSIPMTCHQVWCGEPLTSRFEDLSCVTDG